MNQEYTQRLKKIEAELEYWLPKEPDPVWVEKVFGDIGLKTSGESKQFLLDPLREILSRGGKRWRPLLMTLVCETLGGGDAAIPITPIVEFSHTATLIHDDIEDESDERRGKPAIHKVYGVDTAINSGSFFFFLASSCIESCELKNKELIYKYWLDCMRRVHLGQAMDIKWHRNISYIPEIEEYFLMCKMKTGALSRLSTKLGAHAAEASPEIARLLGDAAEMMGVGYQVLDDVKNLTTGIPGKKRGDDIVEGKKGLPILLYMHKYPEKRERIFYTFHVAKREGVSAPEVEELMDTLTATGITTEAEEIGLSFIKETREIFCSHKLAGYEIKESYHDLLNGFLDMIN